MTDYPNISTQSTVAAEGMYPTIKHSLLDTEEDEHKKAPSERIDT